MNKIVGTQTHTHTHKPATNITGPHKALFSPYRRRTSDVCPSCPHIPGMPGASSESFLLDHPTFYLERQQDHQGSPGLSIQACLPGIPCVLGIPMVP